MSRLFRVFVSSSFLDMAQERRALTEGVFEPLGEFCAARGASFQAVDLRWGISPEAVLEQQTMPTCLAEVRRCVQASPHLNFLALIGDRRGWLPAPAAIPAAEFALLAGAVSPAERDLLDDWYRVDQNAVPSVWRLRARRDVAEDDWTQIERGLREALERVAHHLPQHRRLAYLGSAVEQEIAEGVLTVNDPTGAFAVVRSRVSRDDTDARHLDALEVALRERLPADRILTSRAGDDRHELVEAIRTRFTAVIESVLDDERVTPHPRAVTQVHHNLARRQRAAGAPETDAPLVGRDAETKALVRFARTPGHGMIGLVGTAGAGKSALVAAVADQAAERIPAGGPLVILRLLGTTAATSRLDGLLRGLVDEIAAGLEISAPQAADVPELIGRLAELLAQARAARPILLFLDAVDQLAADHGAHRLVWLPDPLPPHVRVVVSTLPGPTEDALCARTSTATIPLAGLGAEEGRFLLGRWLSAAGRRLTEEQERAVVDAFAVQGNPLWLRLTFEQARRWRSDDAPPALPEDLPGLVRMLLASLTDTAHGPTLVAHALALLAASGHGLSELDILSALSSDPAVMAEVRARTHERWRADISTVPVVLWAQLRADLAPFLTERVVDGDVLHDFYHRVLRDAAARDGLQPPVGAARHRQLAALFARTADPDGTRSWRGASPRALEQVPAQLRAAEAWTELARVLVDVRFVEATASLVARSLGIDGRGRSVVRYGGVHAIRAGLNELLAASPPDVDAVDRAVCSALQRALALEADLLTVQPELLWQQLANRMRWESSPAVAALLDREEARRAAEGGPAWLRLRRPVGRTPGLVHILRERGRAHCCAVSPDGAVLISGGDEDGTLWDAGTGSWLANLPGHSGPVHACAAARDALYTADEAGTLRRWSWDGVRATLVQSGRVGERHIRACAIGGAYALVAGPDGLRLCARDTLEIVALLDESPHVACCAIDERGEVSVAGYLDGSLRVWRRRVPVARRRDGHERSVYGCAVAAAGDVVLTAGRDGALRRWDAALRPLGEPMIDRSLPLPTGIWACAGNRALDKAVTALVGGAVQAWDTESSTVTTLAGHAGTVNDVATSCDGGVVASAGFDGTVRLWDPAIATGAPPAEPFSTMIQTMALSVDGRRVLTVDAYGVVRVGSTGARPAEQAFTTCRSWCRDGAVGSDLGTVLVIDHTGTAEVWDVERAMRRHVLPHPEAAACVMVGERIAVTAGDDGTCFGWDIVHGVRLWTVELGPGVPVLATDGVAVLIGAGSGPVRLVDPATGHGLTLRDGGAVVQSGAFGPGGLVALGTDAGEVLRWRTRDGAADQAGAHPTGVLLIVPGTARYPFLSSGTDGGVVLWPAAAGGRRRRLTGHVGPVRGAAVDPLTGLIATAGDDKTLRVWAASGSQRAVLPLSGNGQKVLVQDGLIACGDDGGFVYLGTLRDHE